MKRKGYPLLVIGLVAIAALALMSAATSAAPKKSYNVAWFSTKSNRFLSAELASVRKEAKKFNIKITVFDSGLRSEQAVQPDPKRHHIEQVPGLHDRAPERSALGTACSAGVAEED